MASLTQALPDRPSPNGGGRARHVQLGTGRCRSRRAVVRTARLQLSCESWSLGVLEVGGAPRGSVTFLVPVGHGGSPRVRGRPMAPGEVAVLFEGEEFDYRSAGPTQLVTVTIERGALEGHVRARTGRHLGELRLQGRLGGLRTEPAAFRRLCRGLITRAAARPRLLRDPSFAVGVEKKLVKALFAGFESPVPQTAGSQGRALALKAEVWLRQNMAEPPTIAALCQALGASERTLHDAFREHLDASPKAYLKILRLNEARRALLRGTPKTRVTDIALDWGFLHFGWFSQDYRRLFG